MAVATFLSGTTLREASSAPAKLEAPRAVDGTEGLPLKDLDAVFVVIEADNGATLLNTGNLRCYILETTANRGCNAWVRRPSWDIAVPAAPAGQRRLAFDTREILCKRGFVTWRPEDVGVSAGSLNTYMHGFNSRLRYTH